MDIRKNGYIFTVSKAINMKTSTNYTNQEVAAGIKYMTSVYDWIKIEYDETTADEWMNNGCDTRYMVEYNAAYELFVNKVLNLRKDQKEAMGEIMLTKVYLRIRESAAYERLEKRLSELEKY